MKKMSKIIAMLLAIIMIVGVMPSVAYAYEGPSETPEARKQCAHTSKIGDILQKATCFEEGVYRIRCYFCNVELEIISIPITDHEYERGACVYCGDEITQDECNHTELDYKRISPTCTDYGSFTTLCKTCTFEKTEMIDPVDHIYANACADACIFCGEKRTPSEHVYDDEYDADCNVCGAKRTPADPDVKPEEDPRGFKDVPKGEYYYDAAMWAVEKGITQGTGDGSTFEPNAICTRGQVVTFLWRAAGQPEPTKTENPFVDVKSGEYYYKAVLWAAENGISMGTKNGDTFEPDAKCNRAQIVTFLNRAKNGQASGSSNPFKDVNDKDYYYNAVLWAVENEITTGTKDGTTFEPNANCSRAQVITFLWRAYNK